MRSPSSFSSMTNVRPCISLIVSSILCFGRLQSIGANARNNWMHLSYRCMSATSKRIWHEFTSGLSLHVGSDNSQATFFKSEQVLNKSSASGWNTESTVVSLTDITISEATVSLVNDVKGKAIPLSTMRTIHFCSSAVLRLYIRWRTLAWISLQAKINIVFLTPNTCVLFTHVLGQLVKYAIQIIDRKWSVNDRRAFAHDFIEHIGEITGSWLELT